MSAPPPAGPLHHADMLTRCMNKWEAWPGHREANWRDYRGQQTHSSQERPDRCGKRGKYLRAGPVPLGPTPRDSPDGRV